MTMCNLKRTFLRRTVLLAVVLSLGAANHASAITIIRNRINAGPFPGPVPGQGVADAGGAPGGSMVGGGSLDMAFNVAADIWEKAILDDFEITINYGWSPLAGVAGVHQFVAEGGVPSRETVASIRFDNDGSNNYFMDASPNNANEFSGENTTTMNLGGGAISVGRVNPAIGGPAFGRLDMVTLARHEIGHALGLGFQYSGFMAEANLDNDVDVAGPLPFPGTVVPLTNASSHPNPAIIPNVIMNTNIGNSRRKQLTAVDILANAQVSGFTAVNLTPDLPPPPPPLTVTVPVPDPIPSYLGTLTQSPSQPGPQYWTSQGVVTLSQFEYDGLNRLTANTSSPDHTGTYEATVNAMFDLDGQGAVPIELTGMIDVKAFDVTAPATAPRSIETEIIAMNLTGLIVVGGNTFNVVLTESDQLRSVGESFTSPNGGAFDSESFFDVFTELSINGGPSALTFNGSTRLSAIPEPTTCVLALLGGLGLLSFRRRRTANGQIIQPTTKSFAQLGLDRLHSEILAQNFTRAHCFKSRQ
jgi:hypothetical protein